MYLDKESGAFDLGLFIAHIILAAAAITGLLILFSVLIGG